MADGSFVRADLDSASGAVSVLRRVAGGNWRLAIARGDVGALDETAPELDPTFRAMLLDLWTRLGPLPAAAEDAMSRAAEVAKVTVTTPANVPSASVTTAKLEARLKAAANLALYNFVR